MTRLTPASVLGARTVPPADGQLDLFGTEGQEATDDTTAAADGTGSNGTDDTERTAR